MKPITGNLAGHKTNFDLFETIRIRFFSRLYRVVSWFMIRDTSWQQSFYASIEPKSGCRIVSSGRGAGSVARALALRFPEASVIGADLEPAAVNTALQGHNSHIRNLTIIEAASGKPFPFETNSFDKAVLVPSFHDCIPVEKLAVVREIRRVLRHGGMLHLAAYDRPQLPWGHVVLTAARYVSGPAATASHLDGSWIEFLAKAGFAGIRRHLSCSVFGARISVIRARKR